ncbi:MAG TPA: alpha-L-fucosidase [Candidatus Eubacterium faecipullorum]|uniref:alpha-L-fucosidase n=1 Tax=Candidatus Eubacterium faecipullorum TaxID=2838571 RepID=A0A9D1RBH0_9FIRM|nr:alpha-L-fucosidase [Candidatus Eubacterium faecipullorum]
MKDPFENTWINGNNGVPLNSPEVERLISVKPSKNQLALAEKPFYLFMHFGMNTATAREWGAGNEKAADFTIKKINAAQWVRCAVSAGATGIILTCKHHDGFCLWPSEYTSFSVKYTDFEGDIVKMVSDECHKAGLDFGVYLSPWDMHEPTYGTPDYNDYFCNQLTELLTGYGEISEVWFDGAKGANAKAFEYDWQRYYKLIRELQPGANIAVCGPDIRWVGNEGGKTRKSEFSVVPAYLRMAETVAEKSQQNAADAKDMQKRTSTDEDLGSRELLKNCPELCWYPAEVDVSIRKGWFYSKKTNLTVKSAKKLFNIYIRSVGNNCTLLLNVPPSDKGTIHMKDAMALRALGKKIREMYSKPVIVQKFGMLKETDGVLDFAFNSEKKIRYIILKEDIRYSQRVEAFDVYLKKTNGKYIHVYSGTVIGSGKIVQLRGVKCSGARVVVRQSRSTPVMKEIGFYE